METNNVVDWPGIMAEWKQSKQSQLEFCRQRGLGIHKFRYRLKAKSHAGPNPGFLEVRQAIERPPVLHLNVLEDGTVSVKMGLKIELLVKP